MRWFGTMVIAAGLWAAFLPGAGAQGTQGVQGIYTCTDAKGRRLTSDRPIFECIDREQRQLSPGGQLVRKIGPSLTAEERAAEEEKARRATEEANRQLEEKKRDRALLGRYPDKAAHDKERAAAITTVDDVIATANQRVADLHTQRKKLDAELEFYRGDMKKAPPPLTRQFEENDHELAAQVRFLANQDEEKKRINARYDEELARLRELWAKRVVPVTARSSSSAAR